MDRDDDAATEELPSLDDGATTAELPPRPASMAPEELLSSEDGATTEELLPRDDGATTAEIAPRSRWRWARRILISLVLLVTAAGIALAVAFEPIARWYVLTQAEQRGVRLAPREMVVEWGRATLFDVRVELDGVPDLALQVEWLEVRADGLLPREVAARGVVARLRSADAVRQVLAFGRARESQRIPARATDVRVTLGGAAADAPAIAEARVAEVELLPGAPARAKRTTLDVPRPRARIGPLDLTVGARANLLEVALGDDVATAPLRASVDLDARRIQVSLRETRAPVIAGWLGRPQAPGAPPWPGDFAVRAEVEAVWSDDAAGALTGRARATLVGLVPPHPPELNGMAFGKDTQVDLDFRARAAEAAISAERLEVVVGALRLRGTGSLLPRGDTFTGAATLRTSIPCTELASSVAVSQLGSTLGSGLGALARQAIAGNVDVRVDIALDAERITRPEVRPSASIRCHLRLLGP